MDQSSLEQLLSAGGLKTGLVAHAYNSRTHGIEVAVPGVELTAVKFQAILGYLRPRGFCFTNRNGR